MIGTCFGIAVCSFLLLSSAVTAVAQVSITANTPAYNFQVLPGSTRQINVNIAGGTINRVNWSVLSTTGGAYATLTTPAATRYHRLRSLPSLPTVQVNIGSGAGTCSISGSIGAYTVSSTATVTVQAQSVDDTSKTAKILFNVCAKTTNVIVAPAYQQAYKSQHRTIQSWVSGDTDETGTWSIVSQPSGGNAVLADTTNRDADFVATVTGRYTLKYTSNSNSSQSATAIVYVSPNSMPSYAATPNGTEPRECYVDPRADWRRLRSGCWNRRIRPSSQRQQPTRSRRARSFASGIPIRLARTLRPTMRITRSTSAVHQPSRCSSAVFPILMAISRSWMGVTQQCRLA